MVRVYFKKVWKGNVSDTKDIIRAADAIAARKAVMRTKKFLVGFDGFVDEIIHAVATRKNNHEYHRIDPTLVWEALHALDDIAAMVDAEGLSQGG